jgi:hypothetical protein
MSITEKQTAAPVATYPTPVRPDDDRFVSLAAEVGRGGFGPRRRARPRCHVRQRGLRRAYFRSAALERAYRDVRAGTFHPLTPDATLAYAGKLALGDPGVTE